MPTCSISSLNSPSSHENTFPWKDEPFISTDPTAEMARPLLDALLEMKEHSETVATPPSRSAPPTSDSSR